MKRVRREEDFRRVLRLVNYCNTQVLNLNDQSIIRVLFGHATATSGAGRIASLEQLASEAHISQASASRFIRKVGYASFADFRENYAREFDELARRREAAHARFMQDGPVDTIAERIYQQSLANVRATMANLDQDLLSKAVGALCRARSVLILGDDHVLSDLYTFQLDLLSFGVRTYLHKNVEAQQMQAHALEAGDALLFASVSRDFVTPEQWQMLRHAHDTADVLTVCLCQDGEGELAPLADHLILFGVPGSHNHGFSSLWVISEIMSELVYEM